MTDEATDETAPSAVVRPRDGRWIAGVCAGLGGGSGLGVRGVRIAFCLGALCGGIGIILYLACWLLFPDAARAEDGPEDRGAVVLAWAAGGVVVAIGLAAVSALLAALGLGWIVFAIVCLVGLVGLSRRTSLPSSAVVAITAALALPATAVALSPVRIALQAGAAVNRPASAEQLGATVYRSGLGSRLIDLRHTALPATGTVRLRIDAGPRRTIVALPSDRCVHVRVDYHVHTFTARFAALLAGRAAPPFRDIVLFNRVYGAATAADPRGTATSGGSGRGPTLDISFSSLGGGLFVRDYPDDVDPQTAPDWPGYPVIVEPRPRRGNLLPKVTRSVIRAWRRRTAVQRAERRIYERDQPGPCSRS